MPDFNAREWACMIPLIIMMVWMGIYTQSFLPPVTKANARLLDQTNQPVAPRASANLRAEAPSMPANCDAGVRRIIFASCPKSF